MNKLLLALFLLIGCIRADDSKPAPTVESLQHDLAAAREMIQWLEAVNKQQEIKISGMAQLCNADNALRQLQANPPKKAYDGQSK